MKIKISGIIICIILLLMIAGCGGKKDSTPVQSDEMESKAQVSGGFVFS